MYEYIKGILTKITAKYIVVETAGIGYLLHVANPYAYSGKMNQEVHVYLHQVVREDAHLLYGFATEEEKQLFLNFILIWLLLFLASTRLIRAIPIISPTF